MNKFFTVLIFALSAMTSISAQDIDNKKWTMSLGAGYAAGESYHHGNGLAVGSYVGYRICSPLEVGLNINSGLSFQGGYHYPTMSWRRAPNTETPDQQSQTIISIDKNSGDVFSAGHTFSMGLGLGLSPIRLFVQDCRHELLVSGQIGLSRSIEYYMSSQKGEFFQMQARTRGSLGYGGRIAYEYKFAPNIGIGAAATWDIPIQAVYATVGLNIHF